MKILFFSQRFLYPMDTGGKIRTGKLLEQLSKEFDITLISNVESPKDDLYFDKIKEICSAFHPVYWKEARKYSVAFYWKVLWRMLSRYPITVINDYSADLERKIMEVLKQEKYDLLICDFLQPSLNFRKMKGYPTLLFQHNVESVIVKRHFYTARNPFLKFFWWSQWKKMKRYEQEACQRFDGIVAVSDVDKETLEQELGAKNVFAIPTGIDTEFFSPRQDSIQENSLVFTGSMDWLPNEDAILFFAREVLTKIKAEIPSIRLSVVGRNPSRYLINELKQYPEIEIVGWVKDVRPYISSHALYIIPLRIGGGTRIKAYEAMAMGKAVVSTHVGIEGLQIQDGDHASLADRPEDFAQAVVKLLKHPEERGRIEKAARDFVERNFSWEKATDKFSDICLKVAGS